MRDGRFLHIGWRRERELRASYLYDVLGDLMTDKDGVRFFRFRTVH